MDDKDLSRISENIKEKIGEENYAKISDSMGELITGNALNLDEIKARDEQIANLRDANSKLISANGNLLKQVPMGREESSRDSDDEDDDKKKRPFNYAAAFDKNGRFIN